MVNSSMSEIVISEKMNMMEWDDNLEYRDLIVLENSITAHS